MRYLRAALSCVALGSHFGRSVLQLVRALLKTCPHRAETVVKIVTMAPRATKRVIATLLFDAAHEFRSELCQRRLKNDPVSTREF